MNYQYFGTDGIRGQVGKAPITADFFLKLGWAVGCVLSKYNDTNIIIGKDTRVSGYMFESALEAGFLSAGVNVMLLGPMPTPAVAYLVQAYRATAGVVISASHNNYQDNGIKFFSHQGFKLNHQDQIEIEQMLAKQIFSVPAEYIGKARRVEQAIGRYIEFCKSTFDKRLNLKTLKLVIDCANGATYHIAPFVFEELGAKVVTINNKPDGFNINQKCGTTDMQSLKLAVFENEADIGIAFDGDGDRVMMVDEKGDIVDGDELVFIIAKYWQHQGELKNNGVVGTQMSNLGMRQSLKALGINFYETEVGDRFVLEKMQAYNLILGGEMSGHIVCLNHSVSGDGIISALQVLAAVVDSKRKLSQLKNEMIKYHQYLHNVELDDTVDFENNTKLKAQIKHIKKTLGENGKVLIRRSGTENLVRIMVEGLDAVYVEQSAKVLSKLLRVKAKIKK